MQIQNSFFQIEPSIYSQHPKSKLRKNVDGSYQNFNMDVYPSNVSVLNSIETSCNDLDQINTNCKMLENDNDNSQCVYSQMNLLAHGIRQKCPMISSCDHFKVNLYVPSQTITFKTLQPFPLIQQPNYISDEAFISNGDNSLFYQNSPKASNIITRIRWTKEEDDKLMDLVNKFGARKWKEIAKGLGTKTAKQCRDHYANCLDPKIRNSLWTVEEEHILLLKYKQYGPHWSRIKSFLPGRTTSMIKNCISMLLKKTESKKENVEYTNFSSNSTSETEEHDSFYLNSNEIQLQPKEFNYHNISFLLNSSPIYTD